jgi:hypothetical protein
MSLFKNTASQKVYVFAFDATTGLPKTGDAANITASIAKDFGAAADLTDTSATEVDSTKAKGYYLFDISQTETNADDIAITARSSTSNIVVVGAPARMATRPPNAGALAIDSSGKVLLQATQSGVTIPTVTNLTNLPAVPTDWLTAAGVKADAVTKIQAGLSTYAGADTSGTTTLLARLTALRAGYLDNLSGGAVALAAGVIVATNNDKTGYSLTQAFPTNFAATSISVGGKVAATVASGDDADAASIKTTIGTAGVGLTNLGDTRIAHLNADVSSRMATYTQPTGFLAATFPSTVADESLIIAATNALATAIGSPMQAGSTVVLTDASLTTAKLGTFALAKGTNLTGFNDVTAAAVRDVDNTSPAAGSLGAKVNSAASAGDPWATNLPGAYGAGTAGNIVGSQLDAAVSTRSTYAGGAVASVTAPVTAGTVTDKTGYSLASLPAIPTDWISSAGVSAAAVTKIQAGLSTYAGGDTSGTTTLLTRLSGTRAGYLDNLSGGAVALAAGVIVTTNNDKTGYSLTTLPALPTDWISAASVSAAAVTKIQAGISAASVWDLATTGHTTSGTFGAAMQAAGSSGDPWATNLPGSYGAGTAGNILGTSSAGDKTGYKLAADGLDAVMIETGVNARQALQVIGAEAAGKLVVDGSGDFTFSALANPGTIRIVATTNSTGRTAVTLTTT